EDYRESLGPILGNESNRLLANSGKEGIARADSSRLILTNGFYGKHSLKALHYHSDPLSPTNARRGQPVLLLPPPQLIQQRDREARPSRAQRMSQRDRSAVHVHSFAIESQ